MIPKEHGAWGMLITTFIVGALCAPAITPAVLLFGGASLSYFLLRAPVLALRSAQWQKSYNVTKRQAFLWLAFYASALTVFTLPLLFAHHKLELVYFFILSLPILYINTTYGTHEARSSANEFVSFAGMSMTAPLAYFVATDELTLRALSLYAVCFLYYSATIFYVKMNVTARVRKNELATLRGKLSIASSALLYQCTALAIVIVLGKTDIAPPTVCVAFLPSLWKTAARALKLQEQVPIKKLGWTEVLHGVIFAVITIASYRLTR